MALMVVVVVHLRSPRQCWIWMMGGDAPADWGVGAPLPQSQLRLPHSRCRCRSRCVVVVIPVALSLPFLVLVVLSSSFIVVCSSTHIS